MMKKLTVWLIVLIMAMAGLCLAALAEDVLLSAENEAAAPEAPKASAPEAPKASAPETPSEPAAKEDPAVSSASQNEASAQDNGQEASPKQDSEEAPQLDSYVSAEPAPDADLFQGLGQQDGDAEEPYEDLGAEKEEDEEILVDLEELLAMELVVRYLYSDGNRDHEYAEFTRAGKILLQTTFVPERAGYVFDFWYVDEGEVKPFEFGNQIERDLTLRAHFVREEREEQEEEELEFMEEEQENTEKDALQDIKVTISSDAAPGLKLGDTVTFFASIEGAEGWNYSTEWMYNDGTGWHAAQDGEGMTYQFELNENNNGWTWKMAVTVLIADGEAA